MQKVERVGMKPVVGAHKHSMMQYSQLASRQVLQCAVPLDKSDNAKLDALVVCTKKRELPGEQTLLLCYTRYPAAALLDGS